ncbi:MAG TPA: NADH-quinone oxidoreductase subunit H [Ktedonobacterales bacterium]
MMLTLLLQLLAVVVVLLCSPLLSGVINRLKAIIQSKRGPSIWQPYRDYWKLLHKGAVVSEHTTWVFRLAPPLVFITPLVVAVLIPVLTAYPLPFAFIGDMLAGGFILSLGGFFTSVAALDTASSYTGMGSSRARVVSLFAEPVVLMVLFTVSLIAQATIPFIVNQTLASPEYLFSPEHWLLVAALFMVILAEAGRIPLDNPASSFELSMIEKSRLIEYSGPDLALMEWGGAMRFFVLLTILLNVLTTPIGLAPETATGGLALLFALAIAIGSLLLKMLVVCVVIVLIESSVAKWRFFRVPEFLGFALALAALAVMAYYLFRPA